MEALDTRANDYLDAAGVSDRPQGMGKHYFLVFSKNLSPTALAHVIMPIGEIICQRSTKPKAMETGCPE
jgi:hypothetical protein